jgi:hypothetical protein
VLRSTKICPNGFERLTFEVISFGLSLALVDMAIKKWSVIAINRAALEITFM